MYQIQMWDDWRHCCILSKTHKMLTLYMIVKWHWKTSWEVDIIFFYGKQQNGSVGSSKEYILLYVFSGILVMSVKISIYSLTKDYIHVLKLSLESSESSWKAYGPI